MPQILLVLVQDIQVVGRMPREHWGESPILMIFSKPIRNSLVPLKGLREQTNFFFSLLTRNQVQCHRHREQEAEGFTFLISQLGNLSNDLLTWNQMNNVDRLHNHSWFPILYQKKTGPTSGPVPIFILSKVVCLTFFVQSHTQFSSGVLGWFSPTKHVVNRPQNLHQFLTSSPSCHVLVKDSSRRLCGHNDLRILSRMCCNSENVDSVEIDLLWFKSCQSDLNFVVTGVILD